MQNYIDKKIEEREELILKNQCALSVKKYAKVWSNKDENDFLTQTIEEMMECLPKEDRPKLGSENQDIYVTYANGFNSCRQEFIDNLNKKI